MKTQEAAEQAKPQGSYQKPTNWKERLADLKYKTAMAHDGLQIAKDGRRQAVIERLIKKTQDGTLQQQTTEPMDSALEGEEMRVEVGNETQTIHYHYAPTSETTTNPTSQEKGDKANSLAKTLASVGLAAAGLGAGAALPIAAWNMTRKPDTSTTIVEDPTEDTNTRYGLQIYRGTDRD